jgi:hypothetical protein
MRISIVCEPNRRRIRAGGVEIVLTNISVSLLVYFQAGSNQYGRDHQNSGSLSPLARDSWLT